MINKDTAKPVIDNDEVTKEVIKKETSKRKKKIETPVEVISSKEKKKDPEKEAKELLINEIIKFVDSMKGKSRTTSEETKHMFALYNNYYNASENSYNCSLCAIRIFTKLEKIRNSNVKKK